MEHQDDSAVEQQQQQQANQDHQEQHHEAKEEENDAQVPLEADEEPGKEDSQQDEHTVMDTSKSPDEQELVTADEGAGSSNDNNNADNNDMSHIEDENINNNNNNNNNINNEDIADNTENNNTNDDVGESNNNFNSDELTTPEVVVEQLKSIAESGTLHIDWLDLQQALKIRLGNVLDHYIERNRDSATDEQYQEPNVEKFNLEQSRNELLELISSFAEAPFTIQRICELLYTPFKYYDKISTFLRGLEKNLRVISPVTWPKQNQIEPTPKNESST